VTAVVAVPSLADCPELDAQSWNELGPGLRKLYGLEAVASDPELTGVDRGVFTWISSHADDATATAYPSLATLARLLARTRRGVIDAVGRLARAGYIVVSERGRPGRSTRYKLTFKGARRMRAWKQACSERGARGEPAFTTPDGEPAFTTSDPSMVNCSSQHGEKELYSMVNCSSPEPTHQPAHQGGVDGGLQSTTSPAAAGGSAAPGGALPLASRGEVENAWFWAVYPKRINVAKANRLLADLIKDGVVGQAALADAARAYARHVQIKRWPDDKYVIAPFNWLNGSRWLDDWAAQEKPAAPEPKVPKGEAKKSATAKKAPKVKAAAKVSAAQADGLPLYSNDLLKADAATRKRAWDVATSSRALVLSILKPLGGDINVHIAGMVGRAIPGDTEYKTKARECTVGALIDVMNAVGRSKGFEEMREINVTQTLSILIQKAETLRVIATDYVEHVRLQRALPQNAQAKELGTKR